MFEESLSFIWVALNIWCICLDWFSFCCVWHQRIFTSLYPFNSGALWWPHYPWSSSWWHSLPSPSRGQGEEVQNTHPRLPFLWKSSLKGLKFKRVHLKTCPDVLPGAEWLRCFVLEAKSGIASQHCVLCSAAFSVSVWQPICSQMGK